MNRRNFIKSATVTSAIAVAFPYISIGNSNKKRCNKSLFTIDELRTYCDKNGFIYVEDEDVFLKEYNSKFFTYNGNDYWLYPRWPFILKNDKNEWYACLRYNTIDWKIMYSQFFLYDIVETTLPHQKEKGEFYSKIICTKYCDGYSTWQDSLNKLNSIKVYDIQHNKWMTPIIDDGICVGFRDIRKWSDISQKCTGYVHLY